MSLRIFCLLLLIPPASVAGEPSAVPPDFQIVQQAVESRFRGFRDLDANDLISRDQAQAVLDDLEKLGWNVTDREKILADVLPPNDALVKRLRSKAGKKFMRQTARYPQAYDRLDHLERLSDGRRILDRLIEGPDGYKLIEYLTSSPGGKNMGRMLTEAPHGHDFNKPTGRIYTQQQLLKRIQQSHTHALKPASHSSAK